MEKGQKFVRNVKIKEEEIIKNVLIVRPRKIPMSYQLSKTKAKKLKSALTVNKREIIIPNLTNPKMTLALGNILVIVKNVING